MMRKLHAVFLLALLLLGGIVQAAPNRCALGLVGVNVEPDAAHPSAVDIGVRVQSVMPGGPAERGGLAEGDVIVMMDNQVVISCRHLAALVARHKVGDNVRVEFMRNGHRLIAVVQLHRAPNRAASMQSYLDTAVGGDRIIRPLSVPGEARNKMRELREEVLAELAKLPGDIDAEKVTDTLQAIRDLARDINTKNGKGWMEGRAGEISLRIKDGEGSVMILGSNNLLTVELYDKDGKVVFRSNIDTPEERAAIPLPFLKRLQNLE